MDVRLVHLNLYDQNDLCNFYYSVHKLDTFLPIPMSPFVDRIRNWNLLILNYLTHIQIILVFHLTIVYQIEYDQFHDTPLFFFRKQTISKIIFFVSKSNGQLRCGWGKSTGFIKWYIFSRTIQNTFVTSC